jgi:hypothetical protein
VMHNLLDTVMCSRKRRVVISHEDLGKTFHLRGRLK